MKSKLFLVLCLHRSGSSATAGSMNHLGIYMGDIGLDDAHYSNLKGHFENLDFKDLNEKIVHRVGASWSQPPTREQMRNCKFPSKDIVDCLSKHVRPVWGLKDPRTLLTFEILKPYLEEIADITYVFVHRPFQASVLSLAEREKISMTKSKQILTPYLENKNNYLRMLQNENQDIIHVLYEEMLKDPAPYVYEFNRRLGRKPDHSLEKVKNFLDRRLKHF